MLRLTDHLKTLRTIYSPYLKQGAFPIRIEQSILLDLEETKVKLAYCEKEIQSDHEALIEAYRERDRLRAELEEVRKDKESVRFILRNYQGNNWRRISEELAVPLVKFVDTGHCFLPFDLPTQHPTTDTVNTQ